MALNWTNVIVIRASAYDSDRQIAVVRVNQRGSGEERRALRTFGLIFDVENDHPGDHHRRHQNHHHYHQQCTIILIISNIRKTCVGTEGKIEMIRNKRGVRHGGKTRRRRHGRGIIEYGIT